MAKIIQPRRGTAADWTAINPILAEGEKGYETDTKKAKYGDGVTAWNNLPYPSSGGSGTNAAWGAITGTLANQSDLQTALTAKAADTAVVHNTGNESVAGIKTFSSSPKVPTPGAGTDAANKTYVDAFASRLFVLEFDGSPQSVDFGNFYPVTDTPLGNAFYETWIKLLTPPVDAGGKYDWSAGYGGSHAMLRNPVNGNFNVASIITAATNASPIVITTESAHGLSTGGISYIRQVEGNTAANVESPTITVLTSTTFSINGSTGNGTYAGGGLVIGGMSYGESGMCSFNADDIPYINQWAHSATGVSENALGGGAVVQYYDGVPVGVEYFKGRRICAAVPGSAQRGFMGGSDHSNLIGRIAQYRIFEGDNPRQPNVLNGGIPFTAFIPQTGFGDEYDLSKCQLLVDFYAPQQIVIDKSAGYPLGKTHAGRIRGTAVGVLNERSTYPSPQFVVDPGAPNNIAGVQPVQPAGRVYSPVAAPAGALVFDPIERKNSTYAFDGYGGMGSTESGSLGSLSWLFAAAYNGAAAFKPFGILNEQFVYLFDGVGTFARVAIPQTNLDIRVSRKTYGADAGVSTGVMFRYVNDENYCFVCTAGIGYAGRSRASQMIFIGQVVNGAVTGWTGNTTPCPATNWEVLRVTTKSTGEYAVYCDGTNVVSGTNAQHAAGNGAGIALHGNPSYYGVGSGGAGLRFRARKFTVFTN